VAGLRELIMGFRSTQLVHAAARLDLAEHLRNGPRSAQELAPHVGAHAPTLHRLMRALAALGVLAPADRDGFALTAEGELLRSDADGSLRNLARLYGAPWLWQAYGDLITSVRSGEPAFDRVHGQPFFDHLAHHPDAAADFDAAMSSYSAGEARAVAEAYPDFSAMRHVVDVGGGQGLLLAELLRRHAHLRGTLFERAPVIAAAREPIAAAGLAAQLQAGDFFAGVAPAGADAYLLKSVIHDWDDERALAILRRCRAAMTPPASRLLLIERLLADDPGAGPEAALFDINMLVTVGGRERSAADHEALLRGAGLRMTRVVATACALSIVEAMSA
jgi:O-methyltransferase domain/Dimerisation domain